jgi:hypothetical protein
MKSMKMKLFPLLIGALAANAEPESYQNYQVKKGDTLSQILYQLDLKPLYGRKGTINKTLNLNGNEIKQGGNSIYVDQRILLPIKLEPREISSISTTTPPTKTPEETVREVEKEISSERNLNFNLAARLSFFRIDSTDKSSKDKTIILSELSPEFFGEANYGLTKKDTINFQASFMLYSLQKDDTTSIKNRNANRASIGVNYLRDFGPLTTIVGASIREELYPIAKNLSELTLEKKPILQGTFGIKAPLWERQMSRINGKIGADYLSGLSSKSYDVSSGHRLWTGVDFIQGKHELGLNFSLTNQDTSIVTKKEQAAGISYQYIFGN